MATNADSTDQGKRRVGRPRAASPREASTYDRLAQAALRQEQSVSAIVRGLLNRAVAPRMEEK